MRPIAIAGRLFVLVVVAGLIVAAAAVIPAITADEDTREGEPTEPLSNPEYDPAEIAVTASPAQGDIEPNEDLVDGEGVVVLDTSHSNRILRSELVPLSSALTRVGYTVRFTDNSKDLSENLEDATAYVVIDPGSEFEQEELDVVEDFTDDGGRLLIVAEPDRTRVSLSLFGASVSNRESSLTTLTSRYQMSVDTRYLYNMETNDGNFRHIVVRPGGQAPDRLDDVERVVMYTAAPVYTEKGRVVLTTPRNTQLSDSDESGRYPVAVRDDNVLLLGDSSFMTSDRYNVGDNEEFFAYVVEFLVTGETVDKPEPPEEEEETNGETTPENETVGNESTGEIPVPQSG